MQFTALARPGRLAHAREVLDSPSFSGEGAYIKIWERRRADLCCPKTLRRQDRPSAGPGWSRRVEPGLSPGLVRLVEIPNAFLGGKDGSALWQRAPHCVFLRAKLRVWSPPRSWKHALVAEFRD